MHWYLDVIKKYAVFSGRARRKEYWMFVLFGTIISLVLGILDVVFKTMTDAGIGIIGLVYLLAVLLPSVAVTVRRLHDTDRSAWWLLIYFVPLIGGIVLIVFNATEGTAGPNQYGPDPKAAERGGAFAAAEPGYPQV